MLVILELGMMDNDSDPPNTESVCESIRNATCGFNSSCQLASLNSLNKQRDTLAFRP